MGGGFSLSGVGGKLYEGEETECPGGSGRVGRSIMEFLWRDFIWWGFGGRGGGSEKCLSLFSMGENPFSRFTSPGEVITELARLVGEDGGLLMLSL